MTKRVVLEQHHWTAGDLDYIRALLDSELFEQADVALKHYLNDNPDDMRGLFLLGRLRIVQERYADARCLYDWVLTTYGERVETLLNLAKAYDMLCAWDKSEEVYRRILDMEPDNIKAMLGLSTIAVQRHDTATVHEWADKALALKPDAIQALSNKGFAYLQDRDFGQGWPLYEHGAGHLKYRQVRNYVGEPRWQGETGKDVRLLVYSEQGIGDQIAGIEPLSDVMQCVTVAALDVDPKMRKLFERSFPGIPVHGDALKQQLDWGEKPDITHSCSLFTLHTHFRKSEEDYHKTPYLVADPGLRAMYRGWLDSLGGGLKIGLCLNGGHSLTGKRARNLPLDALLPVLRQPHTFVSLEYQDKREELRDFTARRKIPIHVNSHIQANLDYDDPAALIAELDLVIGVPTTAIHAAGALGTPAFCLVHPWPNQHYCNHGDLMPYYGSVRMFRRPTDDEWADSVDEVAEALRAFAGMRKAA